MCQLGACATSDNINANTGGSTGSGGSSSGGSTGSGGSGSGGSTGSGGHSSGGSNGSGGSSSGGSTGSGGRGGSGGSGSGGSAGGCGNGNGSGGHGSGGSATATADAGPSQYANFSTIQQIVEFKCGGSSCHNSVQAPMFQDNSDLYNALTTSKAPDCMNLTLVQPGSPNQSAMYLAIAGLCPCVPQMPNGCTGGDPNAPQYSCIPPDYIEGVRQWIANGAPQQ
jgi:hypothetical protein